MLFCASTKVDEFASMEAAWLDLVSRHVDAPNTPLVSL
jgi:hypothetical protein